MSNSRDKKNKNTLISLMFFVFLGIFGVNGVSVHAAHYMPHNWMVNGGISYSALARDDVNPSFSTAYPEAPGINGTIGFWLAIERGLVEPAWSHWLEFSYQLAGAGAVSTYTYDKSLRYMTLLPGVSFWGLRTGYVDFGLGAGVGIALAGAYEFVVNHSSGAQVAQNRYSGGISPLVEGRVLGRLWINRNLATHVQLGFRFLKTTFTHTTSATQVDGNLISWSMIVGVTWAFGGVGGTGRSYSEVLPANRRAAPEIPSQSVPKAATMPTSQTPVRR